MLNSLFTFRRSVKLLLACWMLILWTSGCDVSLYDEVDGGFNVSPDAVPAPGTFIALGRDFEDFFDWDRLYAGVGPISATDPHLAERYVHINKRPAEGDLAFPDGTLIVKTQEEQNLPRQDWVIFAMAKRGSTFNSHGAAGWEFFELGIDDNDRVGIVWRGAKPPSGHSYGCLTSECEERGSCNVCHGDFPQNDSVLTEVLDYQVQFSDP